MAPEPIPTRVVEEIKASPQGSPSPATPTTPHTLDRSAAKRAELRKQEQERRRREAVSFAIVYPNMYVNVTFLYPTDGRADRYEHAKRFDGCVRRVSVRMVTRVALDFFHLRDRLSEGFGTLPKYRQQTTEKKTHTHTHTVLYARGVEKWLLLFLKQLCFTLV